MTVSRSLRLSVLALATLCLLPASGWAHFLWLLRSTDAQQDRVHLYFGELAEGDDPDLLDRVADVQVWQLDRKGQSKLKPLAKGDDSLIADVQGAAPEALFALSHDYGVISRGDATFRLRYYAKTGPELGNDAWHQVDAGKRLALDLAPKRVGNQVQVTVKWQGKPIPGAQVKAYGPGLEEFEAESDERGQAVFAMGESGVYSIRARYIQDKGGKVGDDAYGSVRHYSTLALTINASAAEPAAGLKVTSDLPAIPEMVTSFGAAIANDSLFVYGGHTGGAHSYSAEAQAKTLRRLDLKNPKAWETWGEGPGLQGLAMVAHGGKLYRIGGFAAKNTEDEEHDLWSQAGVACFDIAKRKWTQLSPLPEPRSSFDAAVLGDKIYVVGGWKMAGEADSVWHKTAYALDLSAADPQWNPLPETPFQRRALSLAAHQGKIYAVGGMQRSGGPTTRVDIYDPAARKWSQGPSLQGEGMDGFGSSSFATGGRLYVTTYGGSLQRLSKDGSSWEIVGKLERARFFHRLLPLSEKRLLSIGGASMQVGKFEEVDVIELP